MVFLHAEFMSAMERVQNPTVFMKTLFVKNNRKLFIIVNCLRFPLEQIFTKSHKILFLDGKEDK